MKKKYIRPVTEVIVTRPGQILSDSDPGMTDGAAKENVLFNDGGEDDGTDNTGWAQPNSSWDD